MGAGFLSSLCLALLEGGAKLCIVAVLDEGLADVGGTPLMPCDPEEGIRCVCGGGYGCLLLEDTPWFREEDADAARCWGLADTEGFR